MSFHVKSLLLITMTVLLSGCLGISPYGGFIYLSPMDVVKINQERNAELQEYYSRHQSIILKTEITLTQGDLLQAKKKVGALVLTLPNDEEYSAYLQLEYRDNTRYKIESKIDLVVSNQNNIVPLIDYGKIDNRYSDYQLYSVKLQVFIGENQRPNLLALIDKQPYQISCRISDRFLEENNGNMAILPLKAKLNIENDDSKIIEINCT